MKGIDISEFQKGQIDWNKIDIDFCIIRAGYGKYVSQKDSCFEEHYAKCKEKGIPVGAYWYSYAENEAEAKEEAKACLKILKGKKFEYPIYYDVEEKKQLNLPGDRLSNIIKTFCEELEKAGYYVGVYANPTFINKFNYFITKDYTLWLAHWDIPKPSQPCKLWQKGIGRIQGVNAEVDIDESYYDFATFMKQSSFNGFGLLNQLETKKKINVELWVDDHKYSGLLEEE